MTKLLRAVGGDLASQRRPLLVEGYRRAIASKLASVGLEAPSHLRRMEWRHSLLRADFAWNQVGRALEERAHAPALQARFAAPPRRCYVDWQRVAYLARVGARAIDGGCRIVARWFWPLLSKASGGFELRASVAALRKAIASCRVAPSSGTYKNISNRRTTTSTLALRMLLFADFIKRMCHVAAVEPNDWP